MTRLALFLALVLNISAADGALRRKPYRMLVSCYPEPQRHRILCGANVGAKTCATRFCRAANGGAAASPNIRSPISNGVAARRQTDAR